MRTSVDSAILTRRGFIKTTGAAAAIVSLLPGCSQPAEVEIEDEAVIIEEDDAVDVTDSYEETDLALELVDAYELPLGSVLHAAEGNWIPVTSVGKAAAPMVFASALSLSSGNLYEVIPSPITASPNMVIYDIRCSDELFAWVEASTVTREWVLYAAAFADGELASDASALWQGDANWDPPGFAVSGKTVIWQVRPSTSGDKTAESSYCYLWKYGSTSAVAVVESPGRFACPPSVSNGIVTLAPRVRPEDGVYYGVTSYLLENDLKTMVDRIVFPASVRPFQCCRVGERIVTSIEASYDSGGLLGKMGTYIKDGSNGFVRLSREPVCGSCGHGDLVITKSRASYFTMDVAQKSYAILSATDRCVDYGEYPARSGECSSFVTYATVKDSNEGYPSYVSVRNYSFQQE